MSSLQGSENFTSIGDTFITIDDTEMNFEIHCRYNKCNPEAELEILFNDVTRAKTKEKNKAEYKYKTLFLSKVAHEFKNPLICISELIDQSIENLPKELITKSTIGTQLKQIKALSGYLHIIMKDLNFFSHSNSGNAVTIERQETNLYDLIDFCKNIVNVLILKSNKTKAIDLLINVDRDVPHKIITDGSKLKQLLINLLSNSVKFTIYGHILLDVTMQKTSMGDPPMIKFMIKDTGVGMKAENFDEMININKKDGEEASSLGLRISREIAQILGKGLHFKSQTNQGSNFWFFIEAIEDKLKYMMPTKKCKSTRAVKKNVMFNCFEKSELSQNNEEFQFENQNNNFKNSLFDENINFSRADSVKTKELHNILLVKPKNNYNTCTNYSSLSDSSDSTYSEIENNIEKSQDEINITPISHVSKNSICGSLILESDELVENKNKNHGIKLKIVKIYY